VTGVSRDAVARIISDEPTIARARAALREKYGWQLWILDLLHGESTDSSRAWIEIGV
jgi:hypothetical protein